MRSGLGQFEQVLCFSKIKGSIVPSGLFYYSNQLWNFPKDFVTWKPQKTPESLR